MSQQYLNEKSSKILNEIFQLVSQKKIPFILESLEGNNENIFEVITDNNKPKVVLNMNNIFCESLEHDLQEIYNKVKLL